MPFALFVALRYLRDGRLQTLLILTGIGVGVGVIIFLSALITGLQDSLIERTLGSQALVVVRPPDEMPRAMGAAPAGMLEVVEMERPPSAYAPSTSGHAPRRCSGAPRTSSRWHRR